MVGDPYDRAIEEIQRLRRSNLAFALLHPTEEMEGGIITNLDAQSLVAALKHMSDSVMEFHKLSQN